MIQGIDQVLRDFLVESLENLEQLDQNFVALEHDPANKELLSEIFRTIHSIKGGAGFLQLQQLEQISHQAEEVLARVRNHSLALNSDIITTLLHAADTIKTILLNLEQSGQEGEHTMADIIQELKDVAEGKQIAKSDRQSAAEPDNSEAGQDVPRGQENSVQEMFSTASDVHKEQEETTPVTVPPDSETNGHIVASGDETRIHVDVGLLDQLMNLTGELVLARNRVVQFVSDAEINRQQFRSVAQRLNMVVSELQEAMLKTRMQPVKKVFGILPRLVRDLSTSNRKEVDLQIKGQDTELDRTLIEAIKDPLTHLVRNAMDHGLESPDERQRQGKPANGKITVNAYHEGGQVHIEIADDGVGIDLDRVKAKALTNGLITAQQAEEIGARELLNLVFRPGFSTSLRVTKLSGRGVGMDVVKRNLDRIGGTVDVHTEQHQGTSVTLHIPMTLAIIPGLIVAVADLRFIIPQVYLCELVMLREGSGKHGSIETVSGAEVYRLRGELLPLLRLENLLKLWSPETPQGLDTNIVVVSTGAVRFGIVVDDVQKTEEIVVKPLDAHLKRLSCYDGATIMGDGNIALILNVNGLSATAQMNLASLSTVEQAALAPEEQISALSKEDRQTIVLFRAGEDEYYGVPLAFVTRLQEIHTASIETSGGREVLQYREEILPLVRLEPYLNLPQTPDPDVLGLIVFSVDKSVGLVTTEVINTVEISTHIDTETFQQKGVLGSTIVQGHSVLIVDIHGLIEMAYPNWYKQFFVSTLSPAEREQMRILLAEDSQFFLNIEKSYLESAGYQVITAEDGKQALELLETQTVDVVVTDIDMPYCNGYDLAKTIRAREAWQHLPIMAITSLSGDEDRRKGMEAGIDEYQVKLDRDEVLGALERLILRKKSELKQ